MNESDENIRDRKVTVYKVLKMWEDGGIKAVRVYLNDENTVVIKESWGERIKQMMDMKRYVDVEQEIENLIIKFKI